ncbi:MAG: hypothetical protein ACOZCL_06595 [Bacillota bacterium]
MKKSIHYIMAITGLLLMGIGLYFVKTAVGLQGIIKAIPYISVGLGCGIFGHGIGEIISHRLMKNHPDIKKQIEIDKMDERNIVIGNRAKAKAYDIMIYVFSSLMLAFVLMDIDLIVILLLVFAYLFVVGYGIYYRCKYEKEM